MLRTYKKDCSNLPETSAGRGRGGVKYRSSAALPLMKFAIISFSFTRMYETLLEGR